MIITPRIRGFICTTAHPTGCAWNVRNQVAQVLAEAPIADGPKRV
ncbi:MAG: enoyl-[acyl-carrier-protein] reductase FabV, partial [Caulobacteraceae bacterium]|nr:enoyl-[acyl-carrier-protein] reductase FabV [Caulobacteraceae bacterium]